MAQFFETGMGRKYYESDFPKMVKALDRIAVALEAIARAKPDDKEIKADEDRKR